MSQFPGPRHAGLPVYRHPVAGERQPGSESEGNGAAGRNGHGCRQRHRRASWRSATRLLALHSRNHRLKHHLGRLDGRAEPGLVYLKTFDGKAAGKRPLCSRMRLRRAGLAWVLPGLRFLRRCRFSGNPGIGDLAADRAPGLQAGAKIAAHGAQRIQAGSHRNAVKLHRKMQRPAVARQLPGQADAAIAERRVARQVLQRAR